MKMFEGLKEALTKKVTVDVVKDTTKSVIETVEEHGTLFACMAGVILASSLIRHGCDIHIHIGR